MGSLRRLGGRARAWTRAATVVALVAFASCAWAAGVPSPDEGKRVAPYAHTPDHVVTEMLKLARVGPADYVVDLGSGDGRLVIAAVQQFGARGGLGIELDPTLVTYAEARAADAGVDDRVRFVARDLFAVDVAAASVVTVYLFPGVMGRVRDKLLRELAPGTRVVSHDFPFPGWAVDKVATFAAPEKQDYVGRGEAVIYLYTVPPRSAASGR